MTKFRYETIRFVDEPDKVKAVFMKVFYFYLDKEELKKISDYEIGEDYIEFKTNNTKKFEFLLKKGFDSLKSAITGKKTIYLHSNSGIPLIGNGGFGVVDRDTNCIEVKPFCGCNLDCIYCSVDENKRGADFVIEPDYLASELAKVVAIKKQPVEIHIGCQGEPLLYSELGYFIKKMKKIPNVRFISMDTNAILLDKKNIDELLKAGLDRFNVSINSLNPETADTMSGKKYPLEKVKNAVIYMRERNVDVFISPVMVQGFNSEEMDDIIIFAKKIGARVGIQNFLNYDYGKKAGKSITMEEFFDQLRILEKKHDFPLILNGEKDFQIVPDTKIPKPFKKGDIINATIMCQGRLPKEMIAVAKDRCVSVYNTQKNIGQTIKIRIIREKHNIFAGEEV